MTKNGNVNILNSKPQKNGKWTQKFFAVVYYGNLIEFNFKQITKKVVLLIQYFLN